MTPGHGPATDADSGAAGSGAPRSGPQRAGIGSHSGRRETPGGTTRLLGASVHLDAGLAESLIDEFLVEPRRCIPRSPGVDAASVLGDAAASHRRRQWRDGLLSGFAVVVLVAFPYFSMGWLLVGAVVTAIRGTGRNGRSTATVVVTVVIAVVVAVIVFVVASGVAALVGSIGALRAIGATSSAVGQLEPVITVGGVLGSLAVCAVAVVILGDRLLVAALVRTYFTPPRFRPEPDPEDAGLVASLRSVGRGRFAAALQRTRDAESGDPSSGLADVVVFRGPEPFVGAGSTVERHALVVPLEREDGVGRPATISVTELHDAVSRGMDALRGPSSLSPLHRLGDLRSHEQVLVCANDLVCDLGSAEGRLYLPRGSSGPPAARVPLQTARDGALNPQEWARYYRCHYVEGWDRDLTVSCYVALGTDGHLLYLEWVTKALTPIDNAYRAIDDHHALRSAAWSEGLLDLLSFPASIPSRLRRVFRSFRPIVTPPGQVNPAQFGARTTLRELAASGSTGDYFRTVDVRRYANLFDRTVLEAVRTYLAAHGLKIADFDRVASSVVNISGVSDSVIAAGAGARVDGASAGGSAPTGRTA